jgi:transcriptional regulator with XRE-family HTH domain
MRISPEMNDETLLHELGERLSHARLDRNLTQAELAVQAGVAKRTVERLESGAVSAQLSGFLRICRVLGLLDRFDVLIPEAKPGPMELLRMQGRKRQRASRASVRKSARVKEGSRWSWGEPS